MSASSSAPSSDKNTRRKRGLAAVLIGVAGTGMTVAAMASGTLGAFTASITNNANTAGTGTLTMQETNSDGSIVCNSTDGGSVNTNAANCSTINKYGGSLTMSPNGAPVSTTINIKNTGSEAASAFTLTPGACTQSNNGTVNGSATDFCSKLLVKIVSGGTTVYNGTAAGLASGGVINLNAPVAAGASVPFTFTTSIDPTAGNTYQGLAASQPLTWTFSA